MKYGAALALILAAIPLPALAQRGSAHGGSFGSRGGGGHATFSARPGFSSRPAFSARPSVGRPGFAGRPHFSAPRSFAPSSSFRYGPLGPPPRVRYNPPRLSNPGFGGGRNNFVFSRPAYQAGFAGRSGDWDHNGNRGWDHNGNGSWDHNGRRDWDHDGDRDRDRDRFRDRARSFQNWYLFGSPGWLGYASPYYYDPGFYDLWDASVYGQNNQDSGGNDQVYGYQPEYQYGDNTAPGNEDNGEASTEYDGQPSIQNYGQPGEQPPPWPGPGAFGTAPENQSSTSGLSAAFAHPFDGPLTVIFKDGRAPEKMQDYMLTPKLLTDLDTHHYEQIPLDQIDIPATAKANRDSGQNFQVPGASQD
ncbi:MAG TPA: hypothetical protein VGS10_05330 [Terracidiphilus sp.]|nr:hypothetical protein [Terracidiphilus sp.]